MHERDRERKKERERESVQFRAEKLSGDGSGGCEGRQGRRGVGGSRLRMTPVFCAARQQKSNCDASVSVCSGYSQQKGWAWGCGRGARAEGRAAERPELMEACEVLCIDSRTNWGDRRSEAQVEGLCAGRERERERERESM